MIKVTNKSGLLGKISSYVTIILIFPPSTLDLYHYQKM